MTVSYTQEKERISRNLRKYLKKAQMTQKELATMVGVHPDTAKKWAQGRYAPSEYYLNEIARVFNITTEDLTRSEKKVYYDSQGREFTSMPKLCEANDISYPSLYHLVHNKKLSTADACEKLIRKEYEEEHASSLDNEMYSPLGRYPSREYIRWLEYRKSLLELHLKHYYGTYRNEMLKILNIQTEEINQIKNEQFWYDTFDGWCLGEMRPSCARTAGFAYAMTKHPKGIYKEILDFAYENKLLTPEEVSQNAQNMYQIITIPPKTEAQFIAEEQEHLNCPNDIRKDGACLMRNPEIKNYKTDKTVKNPKIDKKIWSKVGKNVLSFEQEQKLIELTEEIRKSEVRTEELKRQKYVLCRQIEEENVKNLPYIPSHKNTGEFCGKYCETVKEGSVYLYWNEESKTYYRKPLYRTNGTVLGGQTYLNDVTQMKKALDFRGYTDITDK